MNRDDFTRLARLRLRDARVLLRSGNYQAAYYLCGHAVECGLKACIAKQTRRYDFPDKETAVASYTHDLTALVKVAQLWQAFSDKSRKDRAFKLNWAVVKDWSIDSRYEFKSNKEARDLYSAVTSRKHGVMQWIRQNW